MTAFPLKKLLRSREFCFRRLEISGIDNESVLEGRPPKMRRQETCLFHRDVKDGDGYVARLESLVDASLRDRRPLPVVRFADGEYSYYSEDLRCNGLYKQAESVEEIRGSLPAHIDAMKNVAAHGVLSPLLYPGNCRTFPRGLRSLLTGWWANDTGIRFHRFMETNGVHLTGDNYVPFFAVYAYLASRRFKEAMDGRRLVLVGSACDVQCCRAWFEESESRPEIYWVEIPGACVATRWAETRDAVLSSIPQDAGICLVGAGIGALLVCVDVAAAISGPVLDAGHIMNMMNDEVTRSGGARLYTHHG
ncbi:MAG: hypothetical protein HQ559_01355 [Lentisphaerae bacterium]|nr:hypothetical protein [Lentisphaerota bacterium]